MAGPLIGTGNVTGGNTVAWTGAVLTRSNCYLGMPVVINKEATFIASRIDTSTFTVAPPVTNGTGLAVAISPLNAENVQVAELNVRAAELMEDLSVIDANGRGLFYVILGLTGANDPQPTFLARDAENWEDVTALYFDAMDANQQPAVARMLLWNIGTVLTVRSIDTAAFASFVLTQLPTSEDSGEWVKVTNLTYVEGDGLIADGESVAVEWNRKGNNADLGNPKGAYAGGTTYSYRDMVTDQSALWIYWNAAPGAGNAPPTLPTQTNSYWQLVGGMPTVDDVLDELGVHSITISTDDPTGGSEGDLWFKVPA